MPWPSEITEAFATTSTMVPITNFSILYSLRTVIPCRCRMRSHDLTADFLPSETAPLPVLYGISAIATKLCFYELDKASRRVTPGHTFNDPDLITDVAPQEQWDCDVLESNG